MISSLQSQFDEYLGDLAEFLGHADRRQPFFDYCNGLLRLKAERSVTRIAAAVGEEACDYQRLHHFATEAGWSDQALLKEVARHTLPWLKGSEKEVLAWIVSEIGIRRRGATFPLVARQPCPPSGDVCLCQVAVVLSLATTTGILPIALRLCPAPGSSRSGQNKFSIALDLVLAAVAQGIPRGTVVLDGDFGASEDLRLALAENKVSYVSKVPAETRIWVPAEVRLPPPGRKSRSDRPWREHAGKFSRSGHLTIAAFMAAQQNFLSWVPYEFMGPERIVRRSYAAVRLSRKTGRDFMISDTRRDGSF